MRRAKVGDYWRAIESNSGWKIRIDHVDYKDVGAIGTGTLSFRHPLNLICGPNGAGKTTLLRAISATLAPKEAAQSANTTFRLNSGSAVVTMNLGGNVETAQVEFSKLHELENWRDDVEVFHIDTSSVIAELQNHFCGFPDIDDALNGVPALDASPDNIETLRYLTNISYSAARVYIVEETEQDIASDEEPIQRPFFEVTVAGATYDSRTMGLGELAAFYLWWSLESASDRSILLIEEPESFLSPMCQAAFAGVLAHYTATKKSFVVATTHSPQIIQSAPKSCLRFVYRDGKTTKINDGELLEALLKTVGLESKVRTIIMVEDNAAHIFARLWINQFDSASISTIEFISMSGDGNVVRALRAFPRNPNNFSLIGLLDGDAEGRGFAGERTAFLPGLKPIEELYREMVVAEIDRVEPILGIENLRQILYPIQGAELHDWFEQLKENSHLSNEQLHLMLFKAWIQKAENREMALRYFGQLRDKLVHPVSLQ